MEPPSPDPSLGLAGLLPFAFFFAFGLESSGSASAPVGAAGGVGALGGTGALGATGALGVTKDGAGNPGEGNAGADGLGKGGGLGAAPSAGTGDGGTGWVIGGAGEGTEAGGATLSFGAELT